jgi:hypothetical protein
VDASTDIAEFLTTRRARITPEQAGLPTYGKRRVPGLRREEVASLAGVSVEYYKSCEQPANSARFTFLDPAAADFYPEWERVASELVAHLRSAAGRNPYDRQLSDLVGELSTRSDEFRVRWAAHKVRFHRTGAKRIHHPLVGELALSYEAMELSADDGLTVAVFTAEPGSASQQALDLLASWTATPGAGDVGSARSPDRT